MLGSNLKKHINEFRRYVGNHEYERSGTGLYFPKAHAGISGMYIHDVNGEDERTDHNVITNEGLAHTLAVVMLGTPVAVTDWYCMLYSADVTPGVTLTAATFQSTCIEIDSESEGYAGSVRMTWTPDAIDTAANSVTNAAVPATFTIVTAGTLTVRGAALTSDQNKLASAGTLISAGKFSADRALANGDEFNLKYKVDFDNT